MSPRLRVALVLSLLLLGLWVRYQLVRMDARFFHASAPGIQGLILYVMGDNGGAARAYRAHWRTQARSSADGSGSLLLVGDVDGAERAARSELAQHPGSLSPHLTLVEIALERGDPREALRAADAILARDPEEPEALLLSSIALARSGAHGPAIVRMNGTLSTGRVNGRLTVFLRALELSGDLARRPGAERPLCLLAHYHRYLRIFDPAQGRVAIRYAEQAIAAGDHPANAYLTMSVVYDFQGKHESSIQAVLKAIEIDPRHADALSWAATKYGDQGDGVNEYRMAKAAFEAAPAQSRFVWSSRGSASSWAPCTWRSCSGTSSPDRSGTRRSSGRWGAWSTGRR